MNTVKKIKMISLYYHMVMTGKAIELIATDSPPSYKVMYLLNGWFADGP